MGEYTLKTDFAALEVPQANFGKVDDTGIQFIISGNCHVCSERSADGSFGRAGGV